MVFLLKPEQKKGHAENCKTFIFLQCLHFETVHMAFIFEQKNAEFLLSIRNK